MPKSNRKPLVFRARRALGGHHDPEITQGMSRGVWASAWGNAQEEKGKSLSGVNLYDAAPRTPLWADAWADKLCSSILQLNKRSVNELFQMARDAGFKKDRESFGYYLGMEAVGSGLHWTDDLTHLDTPKILVPSYEFYKGAERNEPDTRFVKR